ncbi:MAG TPA: hypothetical protein DEA08_32865 [Planctomycetes bacterium]|nr:hypothetical protein [Planctomycetota bacterium]
MDKKSIALGGLVGLVLTLVLGGTAFKVAVASGAVRLPSKVPPYVSTFQAHAILTPALKELGARVEGQGGSGNSMNTPHERPFIQRSAFTVHLPVKVEPSAALEAIDRAFQAHLKAAGMVFDRGAPAGFPMNQISIVNYDYRPPDANLKAGQVTLGLLPLPDRIHVWTVAVDFP